MADTIPYMDDGQVVKMEVDYSATCDQTISEAENLANQGKLDEAIEVLLALEKQTRSASDIASTGRILVMIVKLCFEAKNWTSLNENIRMLCKRRNQLKQAIHKMVQESCTFVDKIDDKENKLKLIETLRAVTEGKLYVEVERARLTHKLSLIKEENGDLVEASNIMQELQIETYGSMSKKEKVELILEQMRLCLAKEDVIRTQIISKKINQKFFDEEDNEELKLKYFNLIIKLDSKQGSYLSICKHYRAIYNTPGIQKNETERKQVLQNVVLYLVLSPYDNEQADLTHRVIQEKGLEDLPMCKEILELFMTPELIHWDAFCNQYLNALRNDPVFGGLFLPSTEHGEQRWKDLKNRVVEHNICTMAKYYTQITLSRMAELLGLTNQETEDFLCNLVVKKTVLAKVDRLAGIVNFSKSKDPNDVLNEWSSKVSDLMKLVSGTTHLINKEEMIHKHLVTVANE